MTSCTSCSEEDALEKDVGEDRIIFRCHTFLDYCKTPIFTEFKHKKFEFLSIIAPDLQQEQQNVLQYA